MCEKRVSNDLANGVNRSNTMVKLEDGSTVIQMQAKRFADLIKQFAMFEQEIKEVSKDSKVIKV